MTDLFLLLPAAPENVVVARQAITGLCEGLGFLGITLDADKNALTLVEVRKALEQRLKATPPAKEIEIVILEDYAYPAYGVPSHETNEAIRFAARTEAMITDPVYEGKSMQGMIDLVKKGFFPEGSNVLYAHLGGAPALNGYSYTYRNG